MIDEEDDFDDDDDDDDDDELFLNKNFITNSQL